MSPSRPQREPSTDDPRDLPVESVVPVRIETNDDRIVMTTIRIPFTLYREIERYVIPGTSVMYDEDA